MPIPLLYRIWVAAWNDLDFFSGVAISSHGLHCLVGDITWQTQSPPRTACSNRTTIHGYRKNARQAILPPNLVVSCSCSVRRALQPRGQPTVAGVFGVNGKPGVEKVGDRMLWVARIFEHQQPPTKAIKCVQPSVHIHIGRGIQNTCLGSV